MQPPKNFAAIIDRKRYSTKTAALVAGDDFWGGRSYERHGRNIFLYRTRKDRYFKIVLTRWISEDNQLIPVSRDEAMELYETLPERREQFEQAFLGMEVVNERELVVRRNPGFVSAAPVQRRADPDTPGTRN